MMSMFNDIEHARKDLYSTTDELSKRIQKCLCKEDESAFVHAFSLDRDTFCVYAGLGCLDNLSYSMENQYGKISCKIKVKKETPQRIVDLFRTVLIGEGFKIDGIEDIG